MIFLIHVINSLTCLICFTLIREDDVLNDLESLKDGEQDKENATSEPKVRTCEYTVPLKSKFKTVSTQSLKLDPHILKFK